MIIGMIVYYPIFIMMALDKEKLESKNLFRIVFSLPTLILTFAGFNIPLSIDFIIDTVMTHISHFFNFKYRHYMDYQTGFHLTIVYSLLSFLIVIVISRLHYNNLLKNQKDY
jgi:hypothetical protein